MANKPLQSIKFPDLPDTYIIPVVDSTLAVSGAAADAKTVGDAIASEDKKALAAFATDTASGAVANFHDGADDIPMKDVLVHIEPVQEGSGDPSPENVRPITGWTAAKVTRTGKNLLPSYTIGRQKTENGITATANADGSITYVGTSTGTFYGLGDSPSILVKAGTYTLSARNNTDISINIVSAVTGSFIDRVTGSDSKVITFANDKKIYYLTTILSGKTIDTTATYQFELGSTATDYEPYHADTYNITFPAEAGTVYGGTLDVTIGVLTVDRVSVDIGKRSIIMNSNGFAFITPSAIKKAAGKTGILCDCYKPVNKVTSSLMDYEITGGVADASLYFKDSRFTTPEEAKAGLSGHYVCYPLETPKTYQLTPQEITSLLGENNLWADTGDTEVEYRADTKLYITKKITEAVSALS